MPAQVYVGAQRFPRLWIAAFLLQLPLVLSSCGTKIIDSDRPREVLLWNFPDNFEPSFITTDENGTKWGLFVSKRYSEKDNLWAVKFVEGAGWQDPIILMNAYCFEDLRLEVKNGSFVLTFTGIDEDYFWDYRQIVRDTLALPATVTIELSKADLIKDSDMDGLPNRLEEELLLSSRLPDSDADGKADNVDYCPLAKPLEHSERFDMYRIAIEFLMRLDDPKKLLATQDTAWTRYYGIYYIFEPTVVFVALPGERFMPELKGLPLVAIQARSPHYFTNRQLYGSFTGGVIPHLVFERPRIDLVGSHAEMEMDYVADRYRHERATIHFVQQDGTWGVQGVAKDEE